MSDSRLYPSKAEEFGVPKKGVWFFTLKAMLNAAPEVAFLVAWDTPPTATKPTGAKCYGYYDSPEQFFKELLESDLTCGYEVFVRGDNYLGSPARSLCTAYGDLEWVGVEDKEHLCARELLRRIFNVCQSKLGFTPEAYVLCGTRETKGGTKNSYHFIIANCWAETCEHIMQLFLPETLRDGVEIDLKEFDLAVYAKTQLIRMPLCSKRGTNVPLRRINTDPRDPEDNLTACFADDDFEAIRPALITVFDKSKSTMHLLKPHTLLPEPEPKSLDSTGKKRKVSLDTGGRDARPRTTSTTAISSFSRQDADAVCDLLVAMHPDQIGGGYDSWSKVVFGVLNEAGHLPEVVKILKEWTRIRDKASHRDEEWPRIAAGGFASAGGRGCGSATIGMGSLVFYQKEYPAACTFIYASNADLLPNCRALLASEDIWMFELFLKFMRHVNYEKTSWKWLVQFASYVVPKLKDQVYDAIQGECEDITKEDFDLVWGRGQPSEIYEFAFKRYLADIVEQINSRTPLVETTAVETDGKETADGTSNPQEAVTTVGHVRTSKPKAQGRQPKSFTMEEVLTLIVKTSASVHSFETLETLRKAVRSALKGQENADKDTEELLGLWKLLQGKSSKTGAQTICTARDEETERDDASMEEDDSEGGSNDIPMLDAGAGDAGEEQDYTTLPELAVKYPSFVLKQDWAPASRSISPETHMVDIFVNSLDPGRVLDHRTLFKTCRLLQLGGLPLMEKKLIENETSIPKKLADFVKQCSDVKGVPFNFAEVAKDWRDACVDIKEGGGWKSLADALFAEVFKCLCSYNAVIKWFERRNFKVTEWAAFCSINLQGQVIPRTKQQVSTNHENQFYWRKVVIPATSKAEERVEIQSAPFLKTWFKDDKMRTYEKVDCIPPSKTGCVVPPGVFNTWTDFRAAKLPAIPADQVNELIKLVISHIRNVICANEEEVQYFLAWLAQHLQDPAHKTEVGIILTGAHGAGKDIILTWYIKLILGTDVGLQIGRASHILGEHATALQNKVLCVLDEANYATLKGHIDLVKDVITGDTLQLNPKGKDPFVTKSLVNLLLTTNHDGPIPMDAGDRRWMALEANDSKKGDTAYFDELGKHLNDRTARAFYQYLMDFDLSNYGNFQAKRPHTQVYQEMKEDNISAFHSFLSHECMTYAGEKPAWSTSSAMFATFMKWTEDANWSIGSYTVCMFGRDLKKFMKKTDSGVTKKRSGGNQMYQIEWCKLEGCLKRYGLFNSSA